MKSSPVFIEITAGMLKALRDNDGVELPLERGPTGKLTNDCKTKLVAALQKFVDRKTWQPRAKAFCAIAANGVSLRRLTLPATVNGDFQKLLLLQIESEFPVSPEELAWGWQAIDGNAGGKREVLVAAVKKEVVEDYADVLAGSGLIPVFTLAALVRKTICPPQLNPYAMIELGRRQSELATFDPGVPLAVRVLSAAADASVADVVGKALGPNWNGRKIFLGNATDELAEQLARHFGKDVACEALRIESGAGRSAAVLGLRRTVERHGGMPALVLHVKTKQPAGTFSLAEPEVKKWAMRAAVLLAVLLVLPYAEALLMKPFLAHKLAKLKAEKVRLTTIDRELEFLQSLKQNQPPYLDALYTFAKSAPQGAKIDSVTMNRRGEVSLRGSMRTGDQVTDFRSKLISSGFFSTVAVEEQAPTPDRQKVNVRITAQWKAFEARVGWTNGPSVADIERAKTNKPAMGGGGGGGFPPGMMPPGMPPGMMMPDQMPSPRPRK